MINVHNITKRYGAIEALRGVSFSIEPGEIVGLLGPNGAGKSTAIKIITGFLHPDDGWVEIDGKGVLTDLRAVQARIGYLSENTPLYPELSVQAYLMMIADLRDVPAAQALSLLSDAIFGAGMQDYLTRPISSLSKGLRQRVGLAQAILHKPSFLILDEPTVGLDPTQIVEIRALIKQLAQESSILFSSHILSDVEAICDRVIIIINGKVKADQNLSELRLSNDATLVLQSDTEGHNHDAVKYRGRYPGERDPLARQLSRVSHHQQSPDHSSYLRHRARQRVGCKGNPPRRYHA